MTFNSHLITKEIFKYFLNVVDSYHGKIILGKLRIFGKWYQSHIKVSNINIFTKKLSYSQMIKITNGDVCKPTEYVGLAWAEIKWELHGNQITVIDIPLKEICNRRNTFFFSFGLVNWYNCKEGCQKVAVEASMPSIQNFERNTAVSSWFMEKMFMRDETGGNSPYPSFCNRFWLPITDKDREGVWVDDNSGVNATYLNWTSGEPNEGVSANCGTFIPHCK